MLLCPSKKQRTSSCPLNLDHCPGQQEHPVHYWGINYVCEICIANSHENYNILELGDVWNLGHPWSSQENIWRSEVYDNFFVNFWKHAAWLGRTHLLRSSAVSKLSKRRLAPPSAQQCHCDEFQSLSKRGKQKGWFKIMRAWPIDSELTPFVDWRNLTFQVFILVWATLICKHVNGPPLTALSHIQFQVILT
jgi:hypothetical protein